MIERISLGQAVIAAIYASPLMAVPFALSAYFQATTVPARSAFEAFVIVSLFFWIPVAVCNALARMFVGWLGDDLSAENFAIAAGVASGLLLVWSINRVSPELRNIGGGALSWSDFSALVVAALCNGAMIYAVWHFGWKSNLD